MKRELIISLLMFQLIPLSVSAQDDDLYFVPKEKQEVRQNTDVRKYEPRGTYYCGSSRDVDEYNRRPARRMQNRLVKVGVDSLGNDVFGFAAVPDTLYSDSVMPMRRGRRIEPGREYYDDDDYSCTRRMHRFDGYDGGGAYDEYYDSYSYGYNHGYADGLTSWNVSIGWYDPWWYGSRYYGWNGWYNSFYIGWHGGPWYGGWYDPWYSGWYDPWWHGGCYYPPVYRPVYYSGYTGTRNHSHGAYGSRRHGTYNGHVGRGNSYRNKHVYNPNSNRGFGNSKSWNNRSNGNSWNNRSNGSSINRGGGVNSNRHDINRGGFGGSRSNRSGFGGGRSGGGSRSGGGHFGGRR